MRFKLNNWLKWGIIGGVLGGVIAVIGFWVLSPSTDSVVLFVILRVIIGTIAAMIIGPILTTRLTKNESK
jgi:zinc transporter ZupT